MPLSKSNSLMRRYAKLDKYDPKNFIKYNINFEWSVKMLLENCILRWLNAD